MLGRAYGERQGRSIYDDDDDDDDYVCEDDYMKADDAQLLQFTNYGNYNDEYDDTYDDNEAGNLDANTEIMMPRRKLLNKG